jgi:tRNA threonylcarbamoyladenosine biosynthesis protein TsaE
MTSFRVESTGRDDTAAVAGSLARRLAEGDAVILTGGLAAGKTTFVQAVVAALGSADQVTSPTFTIAQFYSSDAGRVLHVDTYRLESVAEYRDLGLSDFAESSISLVEWGELVAGEFADPLFVELRLSDRGDDHRDIVFSAGPRWAETLRELGTELTGGAS